MLKLKPFAVLFSVDIVITVKKSKQTETMMSIENKTTNGSSFKVFWWDLSSIEYDLTKIRPKFRKRTVSKIEVTQVTASGMKMFL